MIRISQWRGVLSVNHPNGKCQVELSYWERFSAFGLKGCGINGDWRDIIAVLGCVLKIKRHNPWCDRGLCGISRNSFSIFVDIPRQAMSI